jgi:hypothetical protein
MRRARSLQLEFLEPKLLLSTARAAKLHTPAVVTPLVLDGTLSVDNSAAQSMTNPDGSTTTSTPVKGKFGTLGALRGVWNETVDQYGDSEGMDVLRLENSKGTIIVEFDTADAGPAQPAGHGAVYYQEPQRIDGGTGAYAHVSEVGTIDVTTTSGQTGVASMTLHTRDT